MKLFTEMNREQLKAAAGDALAVLPIGATEQHGPHLPTGTDFYTVEAVSREAAQQMPEEIPIIVTPTLPFGSSHHHFIFGGTMSLTETTTARLRAGERLSPTVQITFLVNGHGGNHELVTGRAR
jgi:creatinine amidohydrolase